MATKNTLPKAKAPKNLVPKHTQGVKGGGSGKVCYQDFNFTHVP